MLAPGVFLEDDMEISSRAGGMLLRWGMAPASLAAVFGCAGASSPPPPAVRTANASATPESTAPAPSTDAASGEDASEESSLLRLSRAWAQDPELGASGRKPADDLARCAGAPREVRAENAALAAAPFVRFEGIATHACDAVLWVFLACKSAADDEGTSCATWTERLVLEPVAGGPARVLGDVESSMGANAGGLFVPFAFAGGDRWILLRAWMFSPGAGGGAVDYGVGVLARSAHAGEAPLQVAPLPARAPSFYADHGCAVAVTGSNRTPTYSQPGFPSDNGGALVAVDLATMRTRTLREERDTTYAVQRVDENAGTVDVQITRHTFDEDCPRGEGALSCSKGTSVVKKLPLPACQAPSSR
jgi:hypothetical protein